MAPLPMVFNWAFPFSQDAERKKSYFSTPVSKNVAYIFCIILLQEMLNPAAVNIKAMWEVIGLQSVSRFEFPFNPPEQ